MFDNCGVFWIQCGRRNNRQEPKVRQTDRWRIDTVNEFWTNWSILGKLYVTEDVVLIMFEIQNLLKWFGMDRTHLGSWRRFLNLEKTFECGDTHTNFSKITVTTLSYFRYHSLSPKIILSHCTRTALCCFNIHTNSVGKQKTHAHVQLPRGSCASTTHKATDASRNLRHGDDNSCAERIKHVNQIWNRTNIFWFSKHSK